MDRWLAWRLATGLRRAGAHPVVVDLGYGAYPITVAELADRLASVHPGVRLVGVEIDPERVRVAESWANPPRIRFLRGGFEVPLPPDLAPAGPLAIRAANVLRQYPESAVRPAWAAMTQRLAPGGLLVEGTCDELGRLGSWVSLTAGPGGSPQPERLTLSWRLTSIDPPSVIAERLPKALIHRNVPGERIHAFLTDLDAAWERCAPYGSYGVRQRWLATIAASREAGWSILDGPARWRLGEISLPWACVAPRE